MTTDQKVRGSTPFGRTIYTFPQSSHPKKTFRLVHIILEARSALQDPFLTHQHGVPPWVLQDFRIKSEEDHHAPAGLSKTTRFHDTKNPVLTRRAWKGPLLLISSIALLVSPHCLSALSRESTPYLRRGAALVMMLKLKRITGG